jgi:hypothetical protein
MAIPYLETKAAKEAARRRVEDAQRQQRHEATMAALCAEETAMYLSPVLSKYASLAERGLRQVGTDHKGWPITVLARDIVRDLDPKSHDGLVAQFRQLASNRREFEEVGRPRMSPKAARKMRMAFVEEQVWLMGAIVASNA